MGSVTSDSDTFNHSAGTYHRLALLNRLKSAKGQSIGISHPDTDNVDFFHIYTPKYSAAAARVRSISASVWAYDRNIASNCAGAR